MIKTVLRGTACAVAALLPFSQPVRADAPLPANASMAPDPAVKFGRMANGLRYAIMHNDAPAGAISVRLVVDTGSYEESESELGFAHFIEHMAFRSTKQAPAGALDNRFASLGVALGRDQNAETGLTSTIYRIDLPLGNMDQVRTVLDWMRGAADGIVFAPEGVSVERNVVLAEIRARHNSMTELQKDIAQFQLPGVRSVRRDPGGTEATLNAATPASLEAFYRRWYRPENATLIVIGDAPAEALEQAAQQAFSSWTGTGPATPEPAPLRTLTDPGVAAITRSDPAAPWTVAACRFSPADPKGPLLETMRHEFYSQLWTTILTRRLAHAIAMPGSPLVGAVASVERDLPDARSACLITAPTGDKWKEAMALGQAELARFAKDGPTQQETNEGLTLLRSRLGGSLFVAGTRQTPLLAEQIADAESRDRPYPHPQEAARVFQLLSAGVTPADVKKAFEVDWSGTGPVLAATTPGALSKEALLAAWRANQGAAPLSAYADRSSATWAYPDFGKPGRVVKRQEFADQDYVRLHYANGTLLNFKHTNLQSGGVEIRVRFGNGERGLTAEQRLPAAIGANVFPSGGLGKMDFEQVGSAMENITWAFNLNVDTNGFTLSNSTISAQVEPEMRLLTAYMTDPGFRPTIDEKLPTMMDTLYRSFLTDPTTVAVDAMERALFPNQLSLPPREQIAGYKAKDFERLLKPALTRAPIEVTVVGDMPEAEAADIVARTFGALPARPPLETPTGKDPFRHFPERLPPGPTAFHQGPRDKAAAIIVWPLYTASPERRREEYSLSLLSTIFETRLIQQIRGTMGKVYSPSVSNPMPDAADQGYMAAVFETSSQDVDQVVAAARRIAAELASGSITQAEVDQARAPLVAERVQSAKRNEAWASILSLTPRFPDAMNELVGYEKDMNALTLADVRAAAATWLKREPLVAKAVPAPAR
jgi:zinc protease